MSDKLNAAAKAAFLETLKNGGSSTSPKDFTSPTSGYMVGGWASECTLLTEGKSKGVIEMTFVEWFYDYCQSALFTSEGTNLPTYVGTWIENDNIVFDVSVCIEDKAEALQAAKDLGERAIYDVAEGKTIKVQ
jgi:hypothetical protein